MAHNPSDTHCFGAVDEVQGCLEQPLCAAFEQSSSCVFTLNCKVRVELCSVLENNKKSFETLVFGDFSPEIGRLPFRFPRESHVYPVPGCKPFVVYKQISPVFLDHCRQKERKKEGRQIVWRSFCVHSHARGLRGLQTWKADFFPAQVY